MDQNSSNSKPRGRGRPRKTSKIIEQPSSPYISDSGPSTRRLVVQIPSRPRTPGPKKRLNPEDTDQDDEELLAAEQNRAKRRKKDHSGQDNSKDNSPPEGDDDSSDDPFLDEPRGNKSNIKDKGKGKAARRHQEQPEQAPDEDGDVVFDDLWTLDDESDLLMSWSADDQTLLDNLPKAEIALWRRSMRLFGVGPEELFPPNATISRADLPDYVGKDGHKIPNKIHLTAKFCDSFKYIITLPFLAKRRSLLQYLLAKALRLRCGDRCTVPKSFEAQIMDTDITGLLETLRDEGIIGNLTRGQERMFKDSIRERFPKHFPEHFDFHKHLKHFVQANSGMKPQKAAENARANEDEDSDRCQLRTRDLNNIIKAWDSYRDDPQNSHYRLPPMKEYFDENKILKNRKRDASLDQIKPWKKNWVLSQRRRQLRSEKKSNLRDPLGDEILEDNFSSDDAEDPDFNLGPDGRISNDEENQDDDQIMLDNEHFGMGMVSRDLSPMPPASPEAQRIEPLEVLAGPGQNPAVVPAPDEAIDSRRIPGFQHATILPNAIANGGLKRSLNDGDNKRVRRVFKRRSALGQMSCKK